MKYIVDNDLHIHSHISMCSNDPEQNNERILRYAEENGLKTICLTNHFWDETVDGASEGYKKRGYSVISAAKPLPQVDGIRFLFGCETDLNKELVLGLSKERCELFDFIAIPTTHFHIEGFTLTDEELSSPQNRAQAWVRRVGAVLEMDLPFYKVGLAHLTCNLIAPSREDYLEVLRLIPQEEMETLFSKAAKTGAGIEINSRDMRFADDEADIVLRPYRIAKKYGCKFYMGSDAHHPNELDAAKALFEKAVDMLKLTEEDKFIVGGI